MKTLDDLRDGVPFGGQNKYGSWNGSYKSLDGTPTEPFNEEDVAEVLYLGQEGVDDWDGTEAVVIRMKDDRLAAWQTWWGPTGSGFSEDAYGGDTDIWFASKDNLNLLVLEALTDYGRELCGIPREGFVTP